VRGGQEEEVDCLSGGMREQLSVLTRLAFARLLTRDGRPAPVILDDALVYSDDDRIERICSMRSTGRRATSNSSYSPVANALSKSGWERPADERVATVRRRNLLR
jgi:hypothetical protein